MHRATLQFPGSFDLLRAEKSPQQNDYDMSEEQTFTEIAAMSQSLH